MIEGPADFKSSRLTNKERRSNILDEVLADDQLKSYTKRKYSEIQAEKQLGAKKFRKKQTGNKNHGKGKRLRAYF